MKSLMCLVAVLPQVVWCWCFNHGEDQTAARWQKIMRKTLLLDSNTGISEELCLGLLLEEDDVDNLNDYQQEMLMMQ